MNVFYVDRDPISAASALCDKHVVCMTKESAQMLSTVARGQGHETKYRSTHVNHPCVKWLRESSANWEWLLIHAFAQAEEYARRYSRVHASVEALLQVADLKLAFPGSKLTQPALAMPDEFKVFGDAVSCYREFYIVKKREFATWKNPSKPPSWWR